MSDRIAPARLEFQAWRKARLIGIPTGGAGLLPEHKAWLDETVRQIRFREHYWIDIVGYASKLKQRGSNNEAQSIQYNRELSYKRAAEVAFTSSRMLPK